MGVIKDISGKRYGRLVAIKRVEKKYQNRKSRWICQCDCGKITIVQIDKLQCGVTKSCGCLKKELAVNIIQNYNTKKRNQIPSEKEIKDRKTRRRIYDSYRHMINRCANPRYHNYKSYGGRGISVCEEWKKSFESFYKWALDNGYKDNLTLDRIDVNGNYEESNCRWITLKEQAYNKRNNIKIQIHDVEYTIKEISELTGLKESTIRGRYSNGWKDEEFLLSFRERRKNAYKVKA